MSKIKILVVEDDLIFATKLEITLIDLGYEVINIVDNYSEAIRCFYATEPDVIIIDIFINGTLNGIDVAEKINSDQKYSKPIIFLTANESKEVFLKAKNVLPSAFLLKPFDPKSMQYSIELAFENFSKQKINIELENSLFIKDNIFIKKDKKIVKVSKSEILYIEVESKYCTLYTTCDKFLLRISLKEILNFLKSGYFFRIHRNWIVNMDKVSSFDIEESTVSIADKILPIGKSYKKPINDSLTYLK